jgi:glycosyltransferase involved in cell wall biosynthesis
MKKTRISFVIAAYNGATYIEEQLTSILKSLGNDDEIIVSDDSSTDDTLATVKAINDTRIRVLSGEPKLGYLRNFERAIHAARGKYIFFSDQDDICLPARIPKSLSALIENDCVCGDAIVVDSNLRNLHDSYFSNRRTNFSPIMLFLRPSVIGATIACRKEFLMQNLPFPRYWPHDQWLSIQAALQHQLTVIHEPFILYRRHQATLSPTATARQRPIRIRIIERCRMIWTMLLFRLHRLGRQAP